VAKRQQPQVERASQTTKRIAKLSDEQLKGIAQFWVREVLLNDWPVVPIHRRRRHDCFRRGHASEDRSQITFGEAPVDYLFQGVGRCDDIVYLTEGVTP